MDVSPIFVSLKTAFFSSIITVILGLVLARLVLSIKHQWIKNSLDVLFTMPLVLPPTVLGYILLVVFGKYGPIGKALEAWFGITVVFSFSATVIAAIVVSFPLMYRSTKTAFESVDKDMIFAARTLGLSEIKIFFSILIPNSLGGIVSGAILAVARGLGEFGATAMLAGNIAGKTRTLPLAVYSEVLSGDMVAAGKYVLVILIICFIAVFGMNMYSYRQQKKRNTQCEL